MTARTPALAAAFALWAVAAAVAVLGVLYDLVSVAL